VLVMLMDCGGILILVLNGVDVDGKKEKIEWK